MSRPRKRGTTQQKYQCSDCCEEYDVYDLYQGVSVKRHPINKLIPLLCDLCFDEYRNLNMLED